MKKLLVFSALALSVASASAQAMNAKRAGQGFTDIMGDFTNASANPALMTRYNDNDDFYFSLGIGALGADPGDAIDNVEDIDEIMDRFDAAVGGSYNVSPGDADKLRASLKNLSEETLFLREGVELSIAIPNRYVSTSFFVKQRGRIAALADYRDDAYLEQVANDPSLYDEDMLESTISAAGYSVADAGFALGYEIDTASIPLLTSLGVGVNLKYQRLDFIDYHAKIVDFDEDDITGDDVKDSSTGVNADIGAVMTFDEAQRWSASVVFRDLKENSVTNNNGQEFTTDTRGIIGAGYQGKLFSLSGQVDVNEHGELGNVLEPVQYASIGAEFNMWKHAQLRAGYRTELNDVEEDLITAGIGLSPFDLFALDIAAFSGANDNLGGVVQFGLKF